MVSALVLCSFAAVFPHSVLAGFLGSHGHHISEPGLNNGMPGSDILQELERVVGRDHRIATEARVSRLENTLRPMFASMPKDSNGRLDGTGVRYLLHRLFSQRHAWFVDGLSNDGNGWNNSSPTAVFKNHSGDHHAFFENQLNEQGFTLHQVAVFGAALEASVHNDNVERLQAAYGALEMSQSEAVSDDEAVGVMIAYMMMFTEGVMNYSTMTKRSLQKMRLDILDARPLWPSTVQFVSEVRKAVLEDTPADEHKSYATNLKIVEDIGERYGRWQNKECHIMKNELMKVESPGTGRVPLEDFYQDSELFDFMESVPYLRLLGALDESDPERLSVIIPNYVNSLSNCLLSVKFYSLCCLSECEALLGTLEGSLAAPDATPSRIIELVSKLPSDTVTAPRTLPATLVRRLEEIASLHEGRVPLHGRLFSQWLHHAYPRECPYPHMSGTTAALLQPPAGIETDYMKGGKEIRKLKLEAEQRKHSRPEEPSALPWHPEEELSVPRFGTGSSKNINTFLRGILFVAVLFSVSSVFIRTFPMPGAKTVYASEHKYCV